MKDKTGLIMSVAGVFLGVMGIVMWYISDTRYYHGTTHQGEMMFTYGVFSLIGGLALLIFGIYKIYINNKNK